MEWVQSINKAIEYMEKHLTEDIHCEDVSRYVHISSFHFQRMFNLLTGMTVGEYIRKRRLSLAGEEYYHNEVYKKAPGYLGICAQEKDGAGGIYVWNRMRC